MNKEWFKEWFNSSFYHLLYNSRNETEAKEFIAHLINFLHPEKDSRMLDIGCGKGRHSKMLASMGYDVTGIDIAPNSITDAKQFENNFLHFYVHDMRLPFWINYFNYAFNFFTSFGYFSTKREHSNAIRTISKSLKPDGILMIDYLNVEHVKENFVASEEKQINGVTFLISRWQDETHFFKEMQIEDNNQLKHLFTERVAKFSLKDLTGMLAAQRLTVENVFGNYLLEEYDVKASPRMIIVSKKINVAAL